MKSILVIWLVLLVVIGCIGGCCTDYVIDTAFGKDLPFIADVGIGLVTGEIIIPAAIVCCIVKACDVETPFFNPTTQPAK